MPVIDASVIADWVAPDANPASPALTLFRRLVGEGMAVLAPPMLLYEVANAMLTGVRRRRWSGADADEAYVRLSDLPIQVINDRRDVDRAWDLSRRHDNFPVYDMLYVAVAERLGVQFITADGPLLKRLATLSFVVALE